LKSQAHAGAQGWVRRRQKEPPLPGAAPRCVALVPCTSP
jgi:hypothetical protein